MRNNLLVWPSLGFMTACARAARQPVSIEDNDVGPNKNLDLADLNKFYLILD